MGKTNYVLTSDINLRKVVEKHSICELVPVEDRVDVLLILADSLAEVLMSNLEPQLGLEHLLGALTEINLSLYNLFWPKKSV